MGDQAAEINNIENKVSELDMIGIHIIRLYGKQKNDFDIFSGNFLQMEKYTVPRIAN